MVQAQSWICISIFKFTYSTLWEKKQPQKNTQQHKKPNDNSGSLTISLTAHFAVDYTVFQLLQLFVASLKIRPIHIFNS